QEDRVHSLYCTLNILHPLVMSIESFVPIILAGGSGTRLWPVSRMSYPKQFCELLDDTLLNKTILRLQKFSTPYLLTSKSLAPLSERALEENHISKDYVIVEPEAKNTAAAIAYLCEIYKDKPETIVGIFPSDHWVDDTVAFSKDIKEAIQVANDTKSLVLIGIQPNAPSSAYGYIEVKGSNVSRFIEKPNKERAEDLLKTKNVFWNSGIFIAKISCLREAFKQHSPIFMDAFNNKSPVDAYQELPKNSFDFEIVEKLKEIRFVKANFKWSDLGSWDQLIENYGGSLAKTYEVKSKNNTVVTSRSKSTGFIGVENLLVVDTKDALLIAKKGETQGVKDVVEMMILQNDRRAIDPVKELRGWGEFCILEEEESFKVKKVKVMPQKSISYQSHQNRQEHWIILKGEAEVLLDDVAHKLKAGESIFVKSGVKHLIRCISQNPLELIEVQTGTYFGEDDIKRY
ncbi:MAG: cupin domain-containing protein, partial [Bdellovibrionales bacterium]|nr:cupin domain-containing protein [Bdellovibrionales bacterium]